MSNSDDLRLIEDYLPIEAISAEASREKSVRKGHISTLHLWWARRPLVACRAAVYAALVPADRWVKGVELKTAPEDSAKAEKVKNGKKKGLNRKAAKEFVTKLCRYPKTDPTKPADVKLKRETEAAIVDAQRHILEAHANRLTAELAEANQSGKVPSWVGEFKFTGTKVTYDDIDSGRAPRPRVLDMFAGGGAIPLEALRLGCDAYALDLNPVAHMIELCTLVYPQNYGQRDSAARGMTGPKNTQGETTWGGLADEVRYWANCVLDRVRKEIGDLYPPIPDPEVWATPPQIAFNRETGQWDVTQPGRLKRGIRFEDIDPLSNQTASLLPNDDLDEDDEGSTKGRAAISLLPGFLLPIAYLWTRTVRCKNPGCAAAVPLVKQTWLCKQPDRYVALKPHTDSLGKRIRFKVVQKDRPNGFDFDPEAFSSEGSATCLLCGTVADSDYVMSQGLSKRTSQQLMAIACLPRRGTRGKVYLADADMPSEWDEEFVKQRLDQLIREHNLSVPSEPLNPIRPSPNARGISAVTRHGITTFGELFTRRQLVCLLAFAREVQHLAKQDTPDPARWNAVVTFLGAIHDRLADFNSALCIFNYTGGRGVVHTFGRHALPMVWDFAETNPFNPEGASWVSGINDLPAAIADAMSTGSRPAHLRRGSATTLPWRDESIDVVVTDPPYYDNVPYADISDFFYVWLKRTIANVHRDHFATELTPKKSEATALASRHSGDMGKANAEYERMMLDSFRESHRVLKPAGTLAVVYAHKTTLGWATLVDGFRRAGFTVTEAWPLDTEKTGRLLAQNSAALASSIFLVGRKREVNAGIGNYEDDVQPELQRIVRERVETLWEMGIAGADLVIACVGAGLRAFTRYEKVEYANGEEVPAEKFLAEVEGAVLDTMMAKLFGQSGATVSAIDPASRFYVLWRFVYKASEIEAGEAIVFTYAQHVELDGQQGLSCGKDALVEKKKAKYRARDFTERGDTEKLGLPDYDGQQAPLIDVLHRVLWLMENRPRNLREFLNEADPDRERLRVLAQALAGAALSGKSDVDAERLIGTTIAERAALGKLLANWRSIIDDAVVSESERSDRTRGQKRLYE
jgi:putative DNA methylase